MVLIIIKKGKKFLLQLRDNKKNIKHPNKWSFFSGGIEKNETPKNTVIRELKEELDIKIKKEEIKIFLFCKLFKKKYFIFETKWNKKISELKLNEGQGMKYFTRKEILNQNDVTFLSKNLARFYPIIKFFKK